MKKKNNVKKYYFVFVLTCILVILVINKSRYDYGSLYIKYAPNYKEKYYDLLDSIDLIKEEYSFIPGEVINLSIMRVNNIFLINKGSNDNVINNSYVVSKDGLIGVIKKVYKNFSVAKVISSKNLNIAVEINDCYGTLFNNNSKSYVTDLINCKEVKTGDPVFTSKYSVSSSNILIGYVSKIQNNKIYIDYSFNPYKLKYVGIIYDKY